MSNHRRSQITDAMAEQLLCGQAEVSPPALRQAFAAAAAAGTAAELAGEQVALAHFRAAHLSPVSTSRRRSLLKTAAAKLIAAKVVIGAGLAAAATGGAAVAAATNHLPGPLHHSAHAAPSVSASHSAESSESKTAGPSHKPTSTPGRGAPHSKSSATSHATPTPSLVGLCTAYDAGVAGSHGKALDNPAFSVLITAAGGEDQVAGFCATILASAHPTGHPANSDHPSGPSTHPNGPPSTHPNGPPSTHPNGPPSTHPSGPPSVSPTRH